MTKFFEKFRKVGVFAIILGLLWQSSALNSILHFQKAYAATTTTTLYAQASDGSGAINRDNIIGAPNDTYSTIQTDGQHVIGKSFDTTGRTETITKVEIYGEYHQGGPGPYTDDQIKLSHNKGATALQHNASDITDTQITADVTADKAWTWTDISQLEVRADLIAVGGVLDNIDLLIDALWVKVTYDLGDTTNPTIASVTTPKNNADYNASSIPAQFSGKAADDASGDGLNAKSTKYYLKNSSGEYWTGTKWANPTPTWLSTIHSETTGNTEVTWTSGANMPTWTDDAYYVKAKATDKQGNTKEGTEIEFYYDNTAPTGSISINDGAKVTSSQNVNLKFSVDESYIDKMKITGDLKQFKAATDATGNWQDYEAELRNQTLTDGTGFKTIEVQFKDKAGNVSKIYGNKIYYNPNATNIDSVNLNGTGGYSNENIHLEYMTSQKRTLTYAEYASNPEGSTAFTAFGKYFDLSLDSSEGVSNLVLYIYYTQADLDAAGITENQITGLYYWNDIVSGWEIYPNQTVHTENVNGYEGYIEVQLDHLTPVVLGADTEAPGIPANFKAEAKDAAVKLTWDKVDDADHYDVRYRKSTNDNDAVAYSEIYILTDTETEISNLENGVEYEFDIRAVDAADNKGEWAVVVQTPNLSKEELARRETLRKQVAYYGTIAAEPTEQKEPEEKVEEVEEEIITEGEVKSEEDVEGETQGARTAVTLGIIIIAIGAALGGYYGYQWWLGEGEVKKETLPKETKTPKPKKKKSNRRW